MTRAFYRAAVILLICLTALPSAFGRQARGRKQSMRPTHLYRVSVRDEKTGLKKFGFIDASGRLVIGYDRLPEKTVAVGEFREGLTAFVVRVGESAQPGGYAKTKTGFIDETGRVVIAPRFDSVREFSEGLAFAAGDGFLGYIDRDGREVFRVTSGLNGDFHEGFASATFYGTSPPRVGYYDRTGRLAIKADYDFADDFSEELAGVVVRESGVQRYGFINRKGEMVIPPRFGPRRGNHTIVGTSRFSEGLACVGGAGGFGFIDKTGEYAFPQRFYDAQDFSEGLAWAIGFDGVSGWIDKTGRWALNVEDGKPFAGGTLAAAQTSLVDSRFSEGLVPFVILSGSEVLRGYMNRKGEVVISPKSLSSVGPFVGSFARVTFHEAAVRHEGATGYIDRKTGQFMEEKYGYIDKSGRFIWREK